LISLDQFKFKFHFDILESNVNHGLWSSWIKTKSNAIELKSKSNAQMPLVVIKTKVQNKLCPKIVKPLLLTH